MAVSMAYGHVPLFDGADFTLDAGERVGLVGRNGCGKSALLRLLVGLVHPDSGVVQRRQELRWAYVAQEPAFEDQHTHGFRGGRRRSAGGSHMAAAVHGGRAR